MVPAALHSSKAQVLCPQCLMTAQARSFFSQSMFQGGFTLSHDFGEAALKKNPRILEIVIERLSCPAECILNLNQTGEFSKLHHSPRQLRESKCPLCHRNLHPRGNGRVTLQREGHSRQGAVTSSTPSSSSSLSSPSSSCRHHSYKHIFQSSA